MVNSAFSEDLSSQRGNKSYSIELYNSNVYFLFQFKLKKSIKNARMFNVHISRPSLLSRGITKTRACR